MIRRGSVIYAGGGGVLEEPRRSQGGSQELRNKRKRRRSLFVGIYDKNTVREYIIPRRVSVIYAGGGAVDLEEPRMRSEGGSQELRN